jgi:hypothetical protein
MTNWSNVFHVSTISAKEKTKQNIIHREIEMFSPFFSITTLSIPSGIIITGTCFIQNIYASSSSLLQGKHIIWLIFKRRFRRIDLSNSSEGAPVGIFKCGSRKEKYLGSVTITFLFCFLLCWVGWNMKCIAPISHGILNYTCQQTARHERKININYTCQQTARQPGSHRLNRSINPLDVNIAALRADNLDSTHRWRFITT